MYMYLLVQTTHTILYRDKGVKVDLGIPYELWDTPSAEVTQLQREVRCSSLFLPRILCFQMHIH